MNKRALITDRERRLVEGPGGIMEMKQTIANKEAEIEELKRLNDNANKFSEKVAADVLDKLYHENQIEKRYREFVHAFLDEPMEPSWEKIPVQYQSWKHMAEDLVRDIEKK